MTKFIRVLAACVCALAYPSLASAQDPANPTEARFHIGPIDLQPRFKLSNAGVDTNVLNQSDSPRRDITATFVPALDSWLNLRSLQLSGKTALELLYFQKSTDQRAANLSQEGRADFRLTRLTPYVAGGYLSSSQRPNEEIDARVGRTSVGETVGVIARLASKLNLDASVRQTRLSFDDVNYLGVSVARVLDRTAQAATAKLLVALTPLTTFVTAASVEHDRFTTSPDRNTDSAVATVGLTMKPAALIYGSGTVGFKQLHALDGSLAGFTGLVADVGVNYLFRDSTHVAVSVKRDTDFAVEVLEPYFVQTGASVSLTQLLVGRVDGVIRAGATRFNFRELATGGPAPPERVDHFTTVGFGVGYRMTNGARVGFDLGYDRRRSPRADRQYEGIRFGGSFTYGY